MIEYDMMFAFIVSTGSILTTSFVFTISFITVSLIIGVRLQKSVPVLRESDTTLKRKTLEEQVQDRDYRVVHGKYESDSEDEKERYTMM
jgi:hypothetical protein